MFEDYLGFGYRYNLIVEDNSEGFEWKPISVCTEPNVLFDKHKVLQFFSTTEEYYKYIIWNNKRITKIYYRWKSTNVYYTDLSQLYPSYKNRVNIENFLDYKSGFDGQLERVKMFYSERTLEPYVHTIFDELYFVELSSLVVNGNELFECSAKFHNYNNQSNDSNGMTINNCFEYFTIKTTVIADNTFGVCYEFFQTNPTIILKEEDFVKILIKIKKQRDFITSFVYLDYYSDLDYNKYIEIELNQYFRWYYFINDKQNIESKSSVITSKRIGLSAELKVSKTSIHMLSVPYMTFCQHLGCRHNFYKLSLDNDIFNYNDNSEIKIKQSKNKQLIYNAEPSLELVDFLSNIGGLFALYFGLSFIDISDIFKLITRRIRFYLQKIIFYRKILAFIRFLKLSHFKILQYIKLITKIPWKMILTIFSSPFFVSQMFDLTINYFHYSTKISFEIVEYKQQNQKISINEFPAITICTEHIFEKAFFDQYYIYFNKLKLYHINYKNNFLTPQSKIQDILDSISLVRTDRNIAKYNLTNSNINILSFLVNHCEEYWYNSKLIFPFLYKYFNINNEKEYNHIIRRLEDKHIYGLNATLDLLDFYVNLELCQPLYITLDMSCRRLRTNHSNVVSIWQMSHLSDGRQ